MQKGDTGNGLCAIRSVLYESAYHILASELFPLNFQDVSTMKEDHYLDFLQKVIGANIQLN